MALDASEKLHAVVLEDNRDLARLFSDLLEVLNCSVDVAWDAEAGLDIISKRTPDLLFCDLLMPGGKNGFDVAREIKANPAYKKIRLVAVTGLSNQEDLDLARQAGFDHIFSKPIKFAQLQRVLDEYKASQQP